MENKEFPEMEEQAPLTEASGFPSDTEVAQEPPAAEDFFADILPDQPVSQENAFFMEPDLKRLRPLRLWICCAAPVWTFSPLASPEKLFMEATASALKRISKSTKWILPIWI